MHKQSLKKFGWFAGVFIPTFLTIIGVIFYLRLGFVVGAAGILGAITIVIISELVVFTTAFSISQISKREVGPGGAFPLIVRTLGYNIGGTIGIPLFLAQAFSVPFYVFGFSEAWQFIFPGHSLLVVSLIAFAAMFTLTFINIQFAVKAQIIIFGLILVSLLSIFGSGIETTNQTPFIRNFSAMPFWQVFALFFPAVTGVLAGIGLSGQLSDPKKDITKGIFWALSFTLLLYISAVLWLGFNAAPDILLENTLIMIDSAAFPHAVLVGVLAATFSSGLVTLIAASRLLQAMSRHNLVPFSNIFAKRKRGEPRNAILLISALTVGILFTASLNKIAFLLTIFFLITYGIINLAFFKKFAKSAPAKAVAVFGVLASFGIIPLINLPAGIIVPLSILAIYFWIRQREVT